MIAAVVLACLALLWWRRPPRRPRDRYEALGPLPPDWRPSSRTIVRTNHLPRC